MAFIALILLSKLCVICLCDYAVASTKMFYRPVSESWLLKSDAMMSYSMLEENINHMTNKPSHIHGPLEEVRANLVVCATRT